MKAAEPTRYSDTSIGDPNPALGATVRPVKKLVLLVVLVVLAKIAADHGFYHRMGDLGYRDADGRLWFCGRKAHRLETEAGMVPAVPVEGIYNEHPDVLRTALVGVGPRGAERPVLCVELEAGKTWSTALAEELATLAEGTRWASVAPTLVHHPGFPTDARHNSKIRREDLKVWAEGRFGTQLQRAS